jgi:cell division protein FtsB
MTLGRIVFLCCLIAASYFVYTAGVSALRSHQVGEQRSLALKEVERLSADKAYLEAVKNYVASDQFVEQEARRRLGYVRDGEIPFVVLSPEVPSEAQQKGEWWRRLFPR